MHWRNLKIKVYGTKKKIPTVETLLDNVKLTGDEGKDRLILQEFIDKNKIHKETINYDGNSIISYDKIIKEYKCILKKDEFKKMSDYFYEFLINRCGSIAHYNKQGWLSEYDNLEKLNEFFIKNEFGENILEHQPYRATDAIKICKDVLQLRKNNKKKQLELQKKANRIQQLDIFALSELIA